MPATSTQFGLSTIGQIAVIVRDVERSVAFYRDTLGLPFLFQAPPALAFFACGSVRLMLTAPEKPGDAIANSPIYFTVGDIRQAHETLKSRDVKFVDEPHLVARMPDHELWMCFLRDPDENLLGLMAEVRS